MSFSPDDATINSNTEEASHDVEIQHNASWSNYCIDHIVSSMANKCPNCENNNADKKCTSKKCLNCNEKGTWPKIAGSKNRTKIKDLRDLSLNQTKMKAVRKLRQ
jgi:hypothetical protein